MRATVTVERRDDHWAVTFSKRDNELLAVLKAETVVSQRQYFPGDREWRIFVHDIQRLRVAFERLGAEVTVLDERGDRERKAAEGAAAARWQKKCEDLDLATRHLQQEVLRLREEVQRLQRERDAAVRERRSQAAGDWAEQLFEAVGAGRVDVVFKTLSKCLHPAVSHAETTALMQQLNAARKKARTG